MIILLGIPSETSLALVASALARRGAPFVLVNQRDARVLRLRMELDDDGLRGTLSTPTQEVQLAEVRSVYWRAMDDARLPELGHEPVHSSVRVRVRALHEIFAQWTEVTQARVINRYSAMASNSSKPYQAQLIAAQGLDVPETLVTNDPEEVVAFRDRHRRVVYKSVSAHRSIVRLLDGKAIARLDQIGWCPVQFQEYVPGRNVRVHVIGDRTFATAIDSEAVDYRYAAQLDGRPATLTEIELPHDLLRRCVDLTASLGLEFAGIDLKQDPHGRTVCFEVNPSPAFSYYEQHTDQPIAEAVAEHLCQDRAHRAILSASTARIAADLARENTNGDQSVVRAQVSA